MAVSKIRKFSSWTLLLLSLISVIVIALFFLGGYVDPAAAKPEPTYTSLLLYWVYVLFGVSVLSVVLFGVVSFISHLKTNPKGAIMSIVVLVAFVALLFITYTIGSPEPLKLGPSFKEYNTPFWLKLSDMWLYSIYVLVVLSVLGVIWGGLKSLVQK